METGFLLRDGVGHIPIIPFHRTWARTELLLAAALNLVFSGGNFLLQLFSPIQHDADFLRALLCGLRQEEALAVGRDVVGRHRVISRVVTLEEHLRRIRGKVRLGGRLHGHHLVSAPVEEFSVARPNGFRAAFRRYLPFASGPRIRLDINLVAARLIRDISQPPPVGRKSRSDFVEPCLQEWLHLSVAKAED